MERLPAHEMRRLAAVAHDDADLERMVVARLGGEPLQYLEGTAAFGPLELLVDRRVLIPRPETEQLWELAIGLVRSPKLVVDLCTGSGALALAIKHRFSAAVVYATEMSPDAASVARLNAERLGLAVSVAVGDLFDPLPAGFKQRVDLVVANPPYVAPGDWVSLPPDVRREPRMALVASDSGLAVLRRIAAEAAAWLAPDGWVAVEIGETQGEAVRSMFETRLADVEVKRDLTGRDRFVIGRRPQFQFSWS